MTRKRCIVTVPKWVPEDLVESYAQILSWYQKGDRVSAAMEFEMTEDGHLTPTLVTGHGPRTEWLIQIGIDGDIERLWIRDRTDDPKERIQVVEP